MFKKRNHLLWRCKWKNSKCKNDKPNDNRKNEIWSGNRFWSRKS